jgi:beta-phosphoglucomutase
VIVSDTLHEIRGFIFDLDGVLTETSEYHYRGWQRLADEEGIPFDREKGDALRGVARVDALKLILGDRQVTPEQFQEMADRKNGYYLEFLEELSPADVLPGARELLAEIRASGRKVSLASASKNARRVVDLLQIGELLDAISDGHSVERSKPAPDLFLHAGGQLKLPAGACVVVEDAASGVEAAHRAGMRCIGIGPADRVGAAELVMPDLSEAKLDAILAALEPVAPPPPA